MTRRPRDAVCIPVNLFSVFIIWNATSISRNKDAAVKSDDLDHDEEIEKFHHCQVSR